MLSDTGTLRVEEELVGKRLDAALEHLVPASGLRARRRMIANGFVQVDGKSCKAGQKLRAGQILSIVMPSANAEDHISHCQPRLLAKHDSYYFFYKPPKIHTENIAGSSQAALKTWCQRLMGTELELLQRLDFNTCGIVCGANSPLGAERFRKAEKNGKCRKYYLALLRGNLKRKIIVKNSLDCENRRKTAILRNVAEETRWTIFQPLQTLMPEMATAIGYKANDSQTLALCAIQRGQRHQIRAHAASIGHPLAGDNLYGGGEGAYMLAHFCLAFPGERCFYLPPGFPANLLTKASRHIIQTLACSDSIFA